MASVADLVFHLSNSLSFQFKYFNMPRVNRLERAIEHPNPVVGCIMVVQEKIRFLGRSLLRCRCTEYEDDMASLRTELSLFRELYQTQRNSLRSTDVEF